MEIKEIEAGRLPKYGAIFMSNRSTIEECFERKLFGLPASLTNFVRGVKVGMLLFLFEYEKRKLYGRQLLMGRKILLPVHTDHPVGNSLHR